MQVFVLGFAMYGAFMIGQVVNKVVRFAVNVIGDSVIYMYEARHKIKQMEDFAQDTILQNSKLCRELDSVKKELEEARQELKRFDLKEKKEDAQTKKPAAHIHIGSMAERAVGSMAERAAIRAFACGPNGPIEDNNNNNNNNNDIPIVLG